MIQVLMYPLVKPLLKYIKKKVELGKKKLEIKLLMLLKHIPSICYKINN
jgi:hypothetical protein